MQALQMSICPSPVPQLLRVLNIILKLFVLPGSCLETGPFGGSMSLDTTARPQLRFTSSPLLVKLVQVRSLKPLFFSVVRVQESISEYFSARVA